MAAVFDQAIYLRRGQEVLPLLAPEALMLPGALRVITRADLDALRVRVGEGVLVGGGEVRTPRGGLVVRRVWRPQPVPTAPLPESARQAARAGLAGLAPLEDALAGRLAELAAVLAAGPDLEAARGLVGLGPGLTPAGDDVLCGLLLGLRASGRDRERSLLEAAMLPLLGRTTAISATLLHQAAQGYAVPPVVALLRAWHRGAGVSALTLAGRLVAGIGHTSGPALVLGLTAALAAPQSRPARHTSAPGTGPVTRTTPARTTPARPQPEPVLVAGATRGTS
ncbi:DUF2877 domain-containing protein [Ornithinimicrobium pratense]|uniref:DUF2877 domain-containing protein n=1 Tax=Ornithinimicrobium pratense TaxID=2593973 RepID=A0A5J6V1S9_9MICO|nr:DUF2877 domain-containing protein [Ornithinimicrobium pratense]